MKQLWVIIYKLFLVVSAGKREIGVSKAVHGKSVAVALWCWILCGFSAGWKSPVLIEVGQQRSCNDRVASCTVSENSFSLWRGWSCCWTPAPMFSRWWCSFDHIQEEFAFCTMLLAALPPSYHSLLLMRPTTVSRMESKRLRMQP